MKLTRRTFLQIGITAFVLYLAIRYWPAAAKIIAVLLGACLPLFLGGAIAYVINILMGFYERLWFPKTAKKALIKARRPVCMVGAILSVVAVLAGVVLLVVPELTACIKALIGQAPAAIEWLLEQPLAEQLIPADMEQRLAALNWSEIIAKAGKVLESGVSGAVGAVSGLASGVVTVMFGLIFAIYLLLGKETLGRQCRRVLDAYLPTVWRDRVLYLLDLLNKSFRNYVVGQCTEAVILGSLCIGGMLLFRMPYATMIGTLVGVTALIPVAGAYIGAGVGAFMILSVSAKQAVWFLVYIVVLQQLEGNLIYPRVVGSSIGLPGIFVLAAVTVGGAMFGVLGMLLGVPLTAALYQAVRDDLDRRAKAAP